MCYLCKNSGAGIMIDFYINTKYARIFIDIYNMC